jgi:hypothetical protein
MTRFTRATAFVALTACTAGWHSLVKYSDAPAPAGEPVLVGVYVAVLQHVLPNDSALTLLEPQPASDTALYALLVGLPPAFWSDSLKREVRAAFYDAGLGQDAPLPALLQAAAITGRRVTLDSVAQRGVVRISAERQVQLSAPGFNRDSTIAAVRVLRPQQRDFQGTTLLLARRPGLRWLVWREHTIWDQ